MVVNDGKDIEYGSASFHIDERLHQVFGHCRLYFQEVPLSNCHGVRFGKYGSFLPDCKNSLCNSPFQANSLHILSYNIPKSPRNFSLDNHDTTSHMLLPRENGQESTTITSRAEGNSSRHDVSRKGSVTCSADQSKDAVPNKRIKLDQESLTIPKNKSVPTLRSKSTGPLQKQYSPKFPKSSQGKFYRCNGTTLANPVKLQKLTDEANKPIREADDLKHSANFFKSSGLQIESTELFFQAALKYLDAASLLETNLLGSSINVELTPFKIYDATSKLLEYCAQEYERCKDMGCAALAYKCLEASNLRIVYTSDKNVRRDCQELHISLQSLTSEITPVINIKNQNYMETTDVPKDSTYPQPAESYPLDSRSRSMFVQLLNFTQYANSAMEASRKSQITFGYASKILEETGSTEIVDCIKRALNYGFHDMKKLLYLVYEAIEALSS